MTVPGPRRLDGLALAVGLALLVGALAAAAALWLVARDATLLQGRLPLGLVCGLLSTLSVAAALVLWREREIRHARRAFVGAVSHELRTSLAQIRMFTETLREDRARSDEERERSAAIIGQEARRLAHLVDTVRRYDALARDGVALQPATVPLSPTVARVLERFSSLASARGILLEDRVPPGLVLHADPEALEQMLASLLDNAVKFGRPGTRVCVGAVAGAADHRFWVEDGGPGIPEEERDSVWEPFRRLGRDPENVTGGGGLGLTVVRALVRLHEGECWVEDAPDGGARFVVELPAPR